MTGVTACCCFSTSPPPGVYPKTLDAHLNVLEATIGLLYPYTPGSIGMIIIEFNKLALIYK